MFNESNSAELLYVSLIEQWGSGVRRIFEEADKLNLLEPKIEEIGMRIRFTVFLAESMETEIPVTPPIAPPVDEHLMNLLQLFSEFEELGNSDIRDKLKINDRKWINSHYINPAMERGYIERTLPDKPSSRNQKYRLTEKGRKVLSK